LSGGAVVMLLVLALIVVASPPANVGAAPATERLTLVTATGEHVFEVEIAETPEQKSRGLMFRTALGENAGMLFPYGEPQAVTMWMRNTYIPLDMVFIAQGGTVHRIARNTEPFSEKIIASGGPVVAVLEVKAGTADRIGLKPGDTVVGARLGK
jgi:uncharacterized membrane protein (UPF0127 family)